MLIRKRISKEYVINREFDDTVITLLDAVEEELTSRNKKNPLYASTHNYWMIFYACSFYFRAQPPG